MKKLLVSVPTVFTALMALTTPVFAASSYYSSSASAVGSVISLGVLLCICLLSVLSLFLFVYLIVDATQRDYGSDNNMLVVGILLIVFLGLPVGYILYWALIMQKYPKKLK